jgi:hypothetical protein
MNARPEVTGRRYARNAALARYLGISNMTLYRWKRDAALDVPEAALINGIEHNNLDEWDSWLRARAVSHVKKSSKRA